jgi:acetyltransferase
MVDRSGGIELIVGIKRDPVFGPIVLVGAGGTAAEVLGDHAIAIAPLDQTRARRLIRSLHTYPLLEAFRGRPALNIDAATDILVGLSRMLFDLAAIQEVEANPVLVTTSGAIALDARVVLRSLPTTAST